MNDHDHDLQAISYCFSYLGDAMRDSDSTERSAKIITALAFLRGLGVSGNDDVLMAMAYQGKCTLCH